MHVEHKLGFSVSETIRAKQNFEQLARDHGVVVDSYLSNNRFFSRKYFLRYIYEHVKQIYYCGVNAHHKNGVAERSIAKV